MVTSEGMNALGPPAPEPLPQPLGLPRHSVRATLALLLCGTLWYLALTERKIPDILWESGLLVVAFYFGVRSTAPAAPVATAATTADHVGGPQPLYLPRGSIRTVLLLGFFGIVAFDWYKGRTLPDTMILILQVLTSYVAGFVLSSILIWRARRGAKPIRLVATLRHLIAIGSLGIVAAMCGTFVLGTPTWMPNIPENFLAWTVAFYFGSRLSP
ncbi:MAG TPA: hypothetical protein VEM95_00545 [Thermoplasmata archaeon]|nr:hypothetical protein [Thermoplasmata archaeon]